MNPYSKEGQHSLLGRYRRYWSDTPLPLEVKKLLCEMEREYSARGFEITRLQKELDAERETNQQLTNQLEALEESLSHATGFDVGSVPMDIPPIEERRASAAARRRKYNKEAE